MAQANLHLQPKWFSDAIPRNPKRAKAILTLTNTVSDAETVTVGTQIFEFKTSGNAGEGKIKVDISGEGNTAPDKAAVKLAQTINANSTIVTATAGEDADENDIVTIEYKEIGTEGNAIAVAETMANATFGTGVTKLSGGQLGTPSMTKNVVVYVTPYYYWCDKEGNEKTVSWKRFVPEAY